MPNHCQNRLTVTGDQNELQRFWDTIQLGEGEVKLTALYPMPDVLEGTSMPTPDSPFPHPNWAESLAKGEITQEWHDELCERRRNQYHASIMAVAETGSSNWWDWALQHWGTKWGDYDHYHASLESDNIDLGYMTAWCPLGGQFWNYVSRQFPTLTFTIVYDEPGMVFCGASSHRNGETLAEQYIDDYSQVIGEPDWDDPDNLQEWSDKLSDLMVTLETAVFSEM